MNTPGPSLFGNSVPARGWLPIDAIIRSEQPAIEWMDVGDAEFTEPFFYETIARLKSHPTVVTELDSLLQLEKIADSVEPTGFIFHSSRCGSTLVANACRALNDSIVISEAPVVDKLASRFFTDAESGSAKEMLYMLFLRAAIGLLGQPRKGSERRYFVKFACTTTLQLERIRRIWPNVPSIFLYRDPVEVIVSNVSAMPQWMQPQSNPKTAAAIVGVYEDRLAWLSPEEFCARALGRFFDAAWANRSGQMRTINYSALTPEQLIKEAITAFGVVPGLDEIDAISKGSRLYSKDIKGRQPFTSDSSAKRGSASDRIVELADKWARTPYERLTAI